MSAVDSREDTDRLLSYFTKQQVKFLDRKLGITFYITNFLIAAYIVGYMFIYQKGYLQLEQAKGATVTHVNGDAYAASSGKPGDRYFSAEELTFPGLENGNIFVATRYTVFKEKRGVCEDYSFPCSTDDDCSAKLDGKCTDNGYCKEPTWCTNEDEKPEVYELDTGYLTVWTRSLIQFVQLKPDRVFSTESKDPHPQAGENVFTIRELLLKCEPLPVRYEEVAELGAAVEVMFVWVCGVKEDDCKPKIKARRLDTIFDPENIGFKFDYTEHIDENTRFRNSVRGVRLFFRTVGIGKKMSVAATINRASLGAALLPIAIVTVDLMMIKLFKLRNKYKARKFELTPDFSEYMDSLSQRKAGAVKPEQIKAEEDKVIAAENDWLNRLDETDV